MRRRANTAAAPAPNRRTIDGSGTWTPEVVLPEVELDELELDDELLLLLLDELLELEEPLVELEVLEVMLPEVVVVVMPELDEDDDDELELDDEELLLELDPLDPELELPDDPLDPLDPEPPLLLGPQ